MRLHEVKMTCLTEKLGNLFYPISEEFMTDLVLASLPPSYNGFVVCYNMMRVSTKVLEPFAMLRAAEAEMQKDKNCYINYQRKMADKEKSRESRTCIIVMQIIDIFFLALFQSHWFIELIGCSRLQYDTGTLKGRKAGEEGSTEARRE